MFSGFVLYKEDKVNHPAGQSAKILREGKLSEKTLFLPPQAKNTTHHAKTVIFFSVFPAGNNELYCFCPGQLSRQLHR
jgi:hypothetical protein